MGVVVLVVVVLALVTGGKQSQLLVLGLSLEFDKMLLKKLEVSSNFKFFLERIISFLGS